MEISGKQLCNFLSRKFVWRLVENVGSSDDGGD